MSEEQNLIMKIKTLSALRSKTSQDKQDLAHARYTLAHLTCKKEGLAPNAHNIKMILGPDAENVLAMIQTMRK